MATVLVDAENVRRSVWPNMPGEELMERSAAWGEHEGHDVQVVWEGSESGDDQIARLAKELEPPVWVVTSDRGLRERVRDHAERIIGGGSFARSLRKRLIDAIPRSRYLVRGNSDRHDLADPHCVARSLLALVSLVCVSAGAAALAPATAVGRVDRDRPGGLRRVGASQGAEAEARACDRRGPARSRSRLAESAVRPGACARGLDGHPSDRSAHSAS